MFNKAKKNTSKENGLVPLADSMNKSIKDETVEILTNIGEVGFDTALNDGILKEVPIISTAVSLFKIGNTLRERSLLDKMYTFVKEMNAGCENETEREKRAGYFKNDQKKRAEELKYLIVLLDRYISTDRAELLAKAYLYYLEKEITWTELVIISECIDRIFSADLKYLFFYYTLWQGMPILHPWEYDSKFLKNYEERYRSWIEDASYLDTSPERMKMHTARLISAGLVDTIPLHLDVVNNNIRIYIVTVTGELLVQIKHGRKRNEDHTFSLDL